jgi:hypothetical protein
MDGWGAIGALERASYVCMYVWMDGWGWLAGWRACGAGRQAGSLPRGETTDGIRRSRLFSDKIYESCG